MLRFYVIASEHLGDYVERIYVSDKSEEEFIDAAASAYSSVLELFDVVDRITLDDSVVEVTRGVLERGDIERALEMVKKSKQIVDIKRFKLVFNPLSKRVEILLYMDAIPVELFDLETEDVVFDLAGKSYEFDVLLSDIFDEEMRKRGFIPVTFSGFVSLRDLEEGVVWR